MKFSSVEMEGSLIPPETLDEIVIGEAPGQRPQDFGLSKKTDLDNEIAASWSDARGYWAVFKAALLKLGKDKSSVSLTRDLWMLPLLRSLGFTDIAFFQKAAVVNSKTFAISHRTDDTDLGLPIHIEGSTNEIDKRPPTGRPRISPHSLVQEYLNSSDHLWGLVTNGLKFRILRNSSRLSRPVYLEFNLEQLMESEQFSEFVLFYRLVHRSRWPKDVESSHECLLEKYYQTGIETGGRIREHLREGVEKAILIFGNGFLSHPDNTALRNSMEDGALGASDYYRQILRLIYRFLFLMVSEQRKLIGPDPSFDFHQKVYLNHYSLSRLRVRAERQLSRTDSHRDIWESVKQTFRILGAEEHARLLNMVPLNGDLFGPTAIKALTDCYLSNSDFMEAFQYLSFFRDQNSTRRPINYAFLDVEELGSVYESLLDHYPVVKAQGSGMVFELTSGTERKTTGSYYTRPELVQELIKSALKPVMDERLEAAGDKEAKEKALLSMKICDPAAGSGHFLLAAARTVGAELARIRLGEEQVTPGPYRLAVRDVIRNCIYGVDLNPLAVDLCKVALWIEGHHSGLPLTFLDHRIKCGNSLVGIDSLDRIASGIPSEAFTPVHGDDKAVARNIKKINDRERNDRAQMPLELNKRFENDLTKFAEHTKAINDFTDSDVEQVNFKENLYRESRSQGSWISDRFAANIWTGAFFYPLTDASDKFIPTDEVLKAAIDSSFEFPTTLTAKLESLAEKHKFFHWPLEFPEVFAQGGFDVILGNPPWERIKLQEQEFFAVRDPEIAHAQNKAAREKLIRKLPESNPALLAEFGQAKHAAEATSIFFRHSGRLPLTARGDINTYALFAELSRTLLKTNGRSGIIVPTGIATDDTYKFFFENLNSEKALVSLYDFENREKLFAEVDSRYKFSLLTTSRKPANKARFSFFLTNTKHLDDKIRKFDLTPRDLELINPNTRTAPVFRTKYDAEITSKIYQRVPVLINERTGENPWGVKFATMFHMSNDSHLFKTSPGPGLVPLYEGKMVQAYDHRAASVIINTDNAMRQGQPSPTSKEQHSDPFYFIKPRYWVEREEVEKKLLDNTSRWLLGFKDVTSATNERTAIGCLLPTVGVGHKLPLIFFGKKISPSLGVCFLANFNSLVFDFVVRQKLGGISLTYFVIKQIPVIPPEVYSDQHAQVIPPRVVELVYTSHDMEPFARDCGYDGPPFNWDEDRRAILRAELDAYYAHLYGLTRDELLYILDPEDAYGPDFPGETFRGLKNKDIRLFGEYRTKRLVLEAWDRLFK